MVTNRAMDYPISETASVRTLYEYKRHLTPLPESKMSNHIGINALVYLADGTFLMPLRGMSATISKRLVTAGIATRLIVDDYEKEITVADVFEKPILSALETKLYFGKKKPEAEIHFLGFGRDIYEGDKPQFYFVVRITNYTSDEYRTMYRKTKKKFSNAIDLDRHIFLCKRIKKVKVSSSRSFPTAGGVCARSGSRRNRRSFPTTTCIKTAIFTIRKKNRNIA